MKKYLLFYFIIVWSFSSCKTNLSRFKPVYITTETYNNETSAEKLFLKENQWVKIGLDSMSLKNGTVYFDQTKKFSSGMTSFQLNYNLNNFSYKDSNYVKYNVWARPINQTIYQDDKYIVFGFSSLKYEANRFDNVINKYKSGFDTYFNLNFFGNIIPWNISEKSTHLNQKKITFSVNRIKFQDKFFKNDDRLYFNRIINNSFVKMQEHVMRLFSKRKLDQNEYYLDFYNCSKKLIKKRTDYTMDFKFSCTADSLVIDVKYYSSKKKELNLLIPDILKTRIGFDKHKYQMGNHFDINLTLSRLIIEYIDNNRFITYEF